ncbi:MAG TPA: MerR family transcriptional regulator [Gammaproteobacteria bacterium]|nr:MerR family transcriptional regulator [Gammaproteobacteria bacterium]
MNREKSPPLTIGRLAKSAHVNIETIRYYQRIGLVSEPEKPLQGYRHYPASTIDRICFIKRAQELGFTLKEVKELLALNDGNCREARMMAEHKLEVIQQRINDLSSIKSELSRLVTACRDNNRGKTCCAIISACAKKTHGSSS